MSNLTETATNASYTSVLNDAVRAQKNAQWTDNLLRSSMGMGILSGAANTIIKDPYISQVAFWIEQKKCQAYATCYNPIQEAIKDKDMTRITNGVNLILSGSGKATGATGLAQASTMVTATGIGAAIGAGGLMSSVFLMASGASDVTQGILEIYYGFKGDSLTDTENLISETYYDGKEEIYHLSTGWTIVKRVDIIL